jgi:uncharacterized protein YcfJ
VKLFVFLTFGCVLQNAEVAGPMLGAQIGGGGGRDAVLSHVNICGLITSQKKNRVIELVEMATVSNHEHCRGLVCGARGE